jgi:hypothetical protein
MFACEYQDAVKDRRCESVGSLRPMSLMTFVSLRRW